MRYCSYCGNPLNPGASFCHTCGAALKAIVPEADATPVVAPVVEAEPAPQAEPVVIEAAPIVEEVAPAVEEAVPVAPVVVSAANDKDVQDEKQFLDDTHKFLRWERKAMSIVGKVGLIAGIVCAALMLLLGIILAAVETPAAGAVMLVYAVIYGVLFIGMSIVCLKAADKIPQYTDTLYKDFRATYKRCTSIGMIVFNYFFNTIALVFFIINFVRLKSNRAMCERILSRQGVK